ncbi:MAG: hypothetical protein ACTSRU_19680 [Candidatus Hodarchaeales archaeon]
MTNLLLDNGFWGGDDWIPKNDLGFEFWENPTYKNICLGKVSDDEAIEFFKKMPEDCHIVFKYPKSYVRMNRIINLIHEVDEREIIIVFCIREIGSRSRSEIEKHKIVKKTISEERANMNWTSAYNFMVRFKNKVYLMSFERLLKNPREELENFFRFSDIEVKVNEIDVTCVN